MCVPTACCWGSFCIGAEPGTPKAAAAWGRWHPAGMRDGRQGDTLGQPQSLVQSGLRADPAVFQAWPLHALGTALPSSAFR